MAHRSKGSKPAFVLLTLFGCIHFLIGASVLASGCVLTLHGCFDTIGLKNKMHVEYDYSHYWTGGFYLMTAALTWCSGCRQGKRRLTFLTAVFLLLSMVISLFAIVLDGPDWVEWKTIDRKMKFWKSKMNYSCRSRNDTCVCSQEHGHNTEIVSKASDCDQVIQLVVIYGIIVAGAIVGAILCLATLLVMVNSISWKNPWKAYASYNTSYVNEAAFTSLTDVMRLYKKQPIIASSSTSSLPRQNKEYMPAWSLYGSTADELNNHSTPDELNNHAPH